MGLTTLKETAACASSILAGFGEPMPVEYTEDLFPEQASEDPTGVIQAILEPVLLADFWEEDLTRGQAESILKSLRAFREQYDVDIDVLIDMVRAYAEELAGTTEGNA